MHFYARKNEFKTRQNQIEYAKPHFLMSLPMHYSSQWKHIPETFFFEIFHHQHFYIKMNRLNFLKIVTLIHLESN